MSDITVNGATLAMRDQGVGRTVVLVHGSASDQRTWDHQLEVFSQRYRTITYSRRYHWPNERIPPGADYPMQEQVDDLEALLVELGGEPVHLVGASYGAFLALLLAIRRPDLVRSLVLEEPPVITLFVSQPPRLAEILKLLVTRPRTAIGILKLGIRGFGPASAAAKRGDMDAAMRHFGKAVVGSDAYRRMPDERREQVRANAIEAEFLGSGLAPIAAEDIRRVRAPVLLVRGQRSPDLFGQLLKALRELLPDAESVVIPDASHDIHEDNRSAYDAAVLDFLQRTSRAAAA